MILMTSFRESSIVTNEALDATTNLKCRNANEMIECATMLEFHAAKVAPPDVKFQVTLIPMPNGRSVD